MSASHEPRLSSQPCVTTTRIRPSKRPQNCDARYMAKINGINYSASTYPDCKFQAFEGVQPSLTVGHCRTVNQ